MLTCQNLEVSELITRAQEKSVTHLNLSEHTLLLVLMIRCCWKNNPCGEDVEGHPPPHND